MGKNILLIAMTLLVLATPLCVQAADYTSEVRKLPQMGQFTSDIDDALVQKRFDWDSSGNLLYKGVASSDELSSSSTWRIFKYTYNDADYSSAPDQKMVAEGAWTDRATLTYKSTT